MDFSAAKTDLKHLQNLDSKYSVDQNLEAEYKAIVADFITLKIKYESIRQARRLPTV